MFAWALGLAWVLGGQGEEKGSGDLADLKSQLSTIEKARKVLAEVLETRLKAEGPEGEDADFHLRFLEGADREEAEVTLKRRGGQWREAYGAVPYWRQESFQDQFRYLHRGRNGEFLRDKGRYPADPSGIQASGGGLGGWLAVEWRIDAIKEDRFPPGTPVRGKNSGEKFTWMEKMGSIT